MNIAEIRQKYPQYDDLSDEELAKGLHRKFYSDMDFGDFSQKIGLNTPSALQEDIEGGLTAFDRGATFGIAKKIGGALNAIGAAPVDVIMGDKSLTGAVKDRYNEIVQQADKSQEAFANRHPVANVGLEVGGALINPVNKVSAGFIPTKGNLLQRALGSGTVGGGISLLDSELNGNENELGDALTVSAVTGSLPVVGAALRGIGRAGTQVLGKTTGAGDKAISDAIKAGQRGDTSFLKNMRNPLDVDKLEKQVEENFNKIKQRRGRAYNEDLSRIKQETADKKLNLKAVVDDVKTIVRDVEGDMPELVDGDMARVLDKTKEYVNAVYKKPSNQNVDGFDRLKKAVEGITTKEGTPADAIKTQITNSIRNQIMKQSPEYKAVQDAYARDSQIIDDLKNVFSLNRNANSETILKKIQSTARNNANTDWGYRGELLKKIDPTGEIQDKISANALNSWQTRGLIGSGAFYGGLFTGNPLLFASSSPRAVGEVAYKVGQGINKLAPQRSHTPELAQILRLFNNRGE